ncbi:MAG: hypothetical protein FWF88_12595 [Peptococcaceae bacterium]|nr:hypothetical protein [Peptococcaceae bacterium]
MPDAKQTRNLYTILIEDQDKLQSRPQPEGQEGTVDNGQWTMDNGQ